MMRYLSLLFLCASVNFCTAQTIRFQLYRTKACSVVEQLDTTYSLSLLSLSGKDSSYSPKHGTVYLPHPGQYMLSFEGPLIDTTFDIRDTGLFVFRYKEPDHGLYNSRALDTPPLYYRCDSALNGYQEYHYPNGSLEMRGVFKRGYPTDSIVTFYANGMVKKRVLESRRWVIVTKFDSLGHQLLVRKSENKSFMLYHQYFEKEFYITGGIKREHSSVKHIEQLKEYYPNGNLRIKQTKHYRTEYYAGGLKSIAYTWKYKTDHLSETRDFTIRKTRYDTTGHVTRITVYEVDDNPTVPPALNIIHSDWIVSDQKFENGKIVFSVKDMGTNDYLRKYSDELD